MPELTIKTEPVPALTEAVYAALGARHAAFSTEQIAAATGISLEQVLASLQTLAAEHRAEMLPDGTYLSEVAAKRLRETAHRAAAAFHRQHPLRRAFSREQLRAPLAKAADCPNFDAVISYLVDKGVLTAEGDFRLRLPEHEVVLPEGWRIPAEEILAVYRGAGLLPPWPGNFQANYPRDVRVEAILGILAERGDLVRFSDDLFLSAEAIADVKNVVRRLAASGEAVTVASIRNATGSSRRVIVPLLEWFDSEGFTRRVGEMRVLSG